MFLFDELEKQATNTAQGNCLLIEVFRNSDKDGRVVIIRISLKQSKINHNEYGPKGHPR